MFGSPVSPKSFSFTKILGGISKTLNVANQVIPIYQQAKPLIGNAKNILGILKEFNKPDVKKTSSNIIPTKTIKKESTIDSLKSIKNTNNPTFFI